MKLRFLINQAECFRRGIDCPKSIITIEADPAKLPQEERNLIADRLDGINVCGDGNELLVAKEPTYESLVEEIKEFNKRKQSVV